MSFSWLRILFLGHEKDISYYWYLLRYFMYS